MSDPKYHPVVAIDMDGVLRLPPTRPGSPARDLISAEITYRSDAFPTLHHSEPPWDENGEYTDEDGEEFSRTGVEWVHDLLRRDIDVVWATTWQHHANTYFSPVLGLPELPVAIVGDGSRFEDPLFWKAAELSSDPRWVGRPLMWVDDDIPVGWAIENRRRPKDRALTLSFRVGSPWDGLRAREVVELDAWLTLASAPEGHAELRRRRRRRSQQVRRAAERRRERRHVERRQTCGIARRSRARSPLRISVRSLPMYDANE